MKALRVLLLGLFGAILGWFAAAALTMLLGGAFGLTEFEGEKSMTAVFGVGPLGGLIGLIAGCWIGLKR